MEIVVYEAENDSFCVELVEVKQVVEILYSPLVRAVEMARCIAEVPDNNTLAVTILNMYYSYKFSRPLLAEPVPEKQKYFDSVFFLPDMY